MAPAAPCTPVSTQALLSVTVGQCKQSKKPQAAPGTAAASGATESESLRGMDNPAAWLSTAGLRCRIVAGASKEVFTDAKILGT